jgi:membrane protein insertase Oxa1/YidC/SpoIIIJ
MRTHILHGFYAVLTALTVLTLSQDFSRTLRTSQLSQPQFVFTQEAKVDSKQKQQEEMQAIREWAESHTASDKIRYD